MINDILPTSRVSEDLLYHSSRRRDDIRQEETREEDNAELYAHNSIVGDFVTILIYREARRLLPLTVLSSHKSYDHLPLLYTSTLN